jgi:protein-disulfide isomerase
MKRSIYFIALLFLMETSLVFAAGGEAPKESELFGELQGLKRDVSDIKKELKSLRGLIEARLPQRPSQPPRAVTGKVDIQGNPTLGSEAASVVLVEFSDFQCPFCGRHSKNTFPQIKKEFVDTGKIRYVYKDFPLAFHKLAQKAAEAAHCAGEEGKYWEMHELIFENQQKMAEDDLIGHSEELGLDKTAFKRCLDEGKYAEGIKEDIKHGSQSGVTGTPSFILGKVNKEGVVEGDIIKGALPYAVFKAAIEAKLKE